MSRSYEVRLHHSMRKFKVEADTLNEARAKVKEEYPDHRGFLIMRVEEGARTLEKEA